MGSEGTLGRYPCGTELALARETLMTAFKPVRRLGGAGSHLGSWGCSGGLFWSPGGFDLVTGVFGTVAA